MNRSTTSVTVIIPAYNEADNIARAIRTVVRILTDTGLAYEVIVVDDGSIDGTGSIARKIALGTKRMTVVRNDKNMGFGYSVRRGIALARCVYVTVFPSDNEMSGVSLRRLIAEKDTADLVITYSDRPHLRSSHRRFISWFFTQWMNLLFGFRLRYYNGPLICKTSRVRHLPLTSRGFTLFAEVIVRLLGTGTSYRQVPFVFVPRAAGRSTAVTVRSVLQTLSTVWMLVRDRYVGKHYGIHPG